MYYELKQEVYDSLKAICRKTLEQRKKRTINEMMMELMDLPGLPMHCPYHHFIVPAAFLTQAAVAEAKAPEELESWLDIAEERARTIAAGACGECGVCGAAVGCGIFVSIYTKATPKTEENWKWANTATAKGLEHLASYAGPRCCKRTCMLAAEAGVPYINETCGTAFTLMENWKCEYHHKNAECLESKCPYYEASGEKTMNSQIAIIVEHEKMPRKEPGRTCQCMNEPIDLQTKKGELTWVKQEGDKVREGELICEGEVEKKVVEFFAPCDGVLTQCCIGDGEVFQAGAVLGYIEKV